VRNRSSAERGDFVHPGESAARKVAVYYGAQLGGLWLGGAIFPLAVLLIPYRVTPLLARTRLFNTYAAAFGQFRAREWTAMRLEGLALAAFWTVLLGSGAWSAGAVAGCYAAFAVSWSSLQWVYHLGTPLHPIEGAYNLRAPWLVRLLFLNFNYNLTHHRQPGLAWQELPGATDLRQTQPLWYRWLRLARPPVRMPEDSGVLDRALAKTYF
jgi:fatty acid desaturase